MKSRRARSLQPEECGVWLDTAQLKRRALQTVIPCMSSSRLNPLSRRQPIDSALFEFTQTKTPQLCTKQTSMYSFFTPTGKKNQESCSYQIQTSKQDNSPNLCKDRRNSKNMTLMTPSAFESSACLKQTYSVDEPAACSEDAYTSKAYRNIEQRASSGKHENDERSYVLDQCGNQMNYFSHQSSFKTELNSLNSPTDCWVSNTGKKHPLYLSDSSVSVTCPKEEYNKEDRCPPSPLASQLFTQDTQGNTVICHRVASERHRNNYPAAPLQDRTNITQSKCEEDFLNKMFTQDSEGNMVIKH